jgi:hypothetical protein
MNVTPIRLFSLSLALGVPAHAAISADSPFMAKNGPAPTAAAENSPIELRGVMSTPDGLRFAIYEPASQKGNWVKAEESGFGYVVRSYDTKRSQASVDYQGRTQTLTLKEARFDGTAVTSPAPAAGQQARPPGTAVTANPAEEAKRLEQVANEVRRRRAARQAATQQATTPAASASTNATQ